MSKRELALYGVALIVLITPCAGCVEEREEVTLTRSGAGTATFTATLDLAKARGMREMLAEMGLGPREYADRDPLQEFNVEALRQRAWSAEGVRLTSARREIAKDASTATMFVAVEFDSLLLLSASGLLGRVRLSLLRRDDGDYELRQELFEDPYPVGEDASADEVVLADVMRETLRDMLQPYLSGMELKTALTLPTAIRETNGERGPGNTVTWVVSFEDLRRLEDIVQTVVFSSEGLDWVPFGPDAEVEAAAAPVAPEEEPAGEAEEPEAAPPLEPPEKPDTSVRVPVSTRTIPAYAKVTRDYILDENGNIRCVYLRPEDVTEEMLTYDDLGRLMGRVIRREKPPGYVFTEADLYPRGTRPGPTAGVPAGKRALWLDAAALPGLYGLKQFDRFDVVMTATEGVAAAVARAGSTDPQRSVDEPGSERTFVRTIVHDGLVVQPVTERPASGAADAPVPKTLVAVGTRELAAVELALATGARLQVILRSGQVGETEAMAGRTPDVEVVVPGREAEERTAILRLLLPVPGETIAVVGSAHGDWTFVLAEAVGPSGRVVAVDTDPDIVAAVRDRAKRDGVDNVEVVHAIADDPGLPADVMDAIFLNDVLGQVERRALAGFLAGLRGALKADGRLVIRDADDAPDRVMAELYRSGFSLVEARIPLVNAPSPPLATPGYGLKVRRSEVQPALLPRGDRPARFHTRLLLAEELFRRGLLSREALRARWEAIRAEAGALAPEGGETLDLIAAARALGIVTDAEARALTTRVKDGGR